MNKITVYKPSGEAVVIDDTPRKRRWALGKRCTLENPAKESKPTKAKAKPLPMPETDSGD